jgi:hypothetical protein
VFLDFHSSPLALHGEHSSTGPQQWETPPGQLIEGCDGSGRNRIYFSGLAPDRRFLGTAADDDRLQPEKLSHFRQEVGAAQERFDQSDTHSRSRKRQRYPWKTGAAPDVRHALIVGQELADRCAVQNVTIPQTFDFARSDQPTLDTSARQYGGVPLRQLESFTEDECRSRRCGGHFAMFHVKHPPNPPPLGRGGTTRL